MSEKEEKPPKKERPYKDWTDEELYEECTENQRAFFEKYLSNGFNATKAYLHTNRTDNYSTAKSEAHRVLNYPYIIELKKRRMNQHALASNEVLARLGELARGDIGDILDVDEGTGLIEISLSMAKELNLTHLIKKVKQNKRTETRDDGQEIHYMDTTVELYSSATALDRLARVHGLYKDNMSLEVDGVVGVLKTDAPPEPEKWVEMMAAYRKKFNEMESEYG